MWDDDAGSAVCPSCGTLQDSQQIILDTHVETEDNGNNRYNIPFYSRSTLKSFRSANGWDLAGQGVQAAAERNKISMRELVAALASRIGYPALAARAVNIFELAMQKGNFRFGRKARLVAGASLIIALRENQKGETVRDIAYLLDETPVALARIFSSVINLLGLKLVSVDPSWHLPVLQRYLLELKSELPLCLPRNVIKALSSIHLPSALRTAMLLSDLVSRAHLVTGLPALPTACAIYILALEGELSSSLPQCGDLANRLGRRFGASKDVIMRRYKLIYEHIKSLISEVPWLGKTDVSLTTSGRTTKFSKRVEVAIFLKDVIQFQEGKWKTKLESLSSLSGDNESKDSSEINLNTKVSHKGDDETTLKHSPRPRKRRKYSQIDSASQFLLRPLQPPGETSQDFTSHLLTSDTLFSTGVPTRLQLLASKKHVDEITDEELFAEGELEGLMCSTEETDAIAQACDWAREEEDNDKIHDHAGTSKRAKLKSVASPGRINLDTLNNFLGHQDTLDFGDYTSEDNDYDDYC